MTTALMYFSLSPVVMVVNSRRIRVQSISRPPEHLQRCPHLSNVVLPSTQTCGDIKELCHHDALNIR